MKRTILLCIGLISLTGAASSAGTPAESTLVQAVEAIGLTVSDMDQAVDFYSQVLSFQKTSDVEVAGVEFEHLTGVFGLRTRVVRMRLGDESIELTQYLAPRGRPMPVDSRGNDRWFQHIAIIVSDMDWAYQHLRANHVEHASSGPQTLPDWNRNAGGIKAFYFRDPDGHYLEILQFPPGKGDPKWQRRSDQLFLGIDHTAIVVQNTDASLRFYRDQLGLKIAGESENYGTEQEHLNNVFGARLRITALRAAQGPGVELLEYLTPRDGRPMPPDTRSCDLWHWQIRCKTAKVDSANETLQHGECRLVSPGVQVLPDNQLGFGRGLLARDPDGHAVMLTGQ